MNRHHPRLYKLAYGTAPIKQRPPPDPDAAELERKKAEFIERCGVTKVPSRKGEL